MKTIPMWSAVLLALAAGSMMALQSRLNGTLAARLDDPFTGTALVFLISNALVALALIVWKPGRDGVVRIARAVTSREIPLWLISGGLVGGLYVLSQSLVVSTLGVALFSVASVGGQTLGGAIMDRTQIVPGGPYILTPPRILGALLAIAAVAVTQFSGLTSNVPLWMLLLPIAVGIAQGWQQAVNARVRLVARSAYTTTFLNGMVGLVLIVPAAIVRVAAAGIPSQFPHEWWLYSGGMLGVLFIALAPIVVHTTGALVYTLIAITGQLSMAIILDLGAGIAIRTTTIVGVALAMLAVVVGSLRKRPYRPGRG